MTRVSVILGGVFLICTGFIAGAVFLQPIVGLILIGGGLATFAIGVILPDKEQEQKTCCNAYYHSVPLEKTGSCLCCGEVLYANERYCWRCR